MLTTTNAFDKEKVNRVSLKAAVIVSGLILAYVFARYLGPQWIVSLFKQGSIDLLNKIVGSGTGQPLGFYTARMEELYWGPMAMVFSGLLLAVSCLRFCQNPKGLKFGFIVLVYFILTKWNVLFFPPYGDTIAGPFAEAIWLKENHFDYAGLSQQPGYIYGGPKVYLFSVYPTFLAVLMKLIPNVTAFLIVNHLLVFVLVAVAINYFRRTLLRFSSVTTATLTSILLLSVPLFQAQSEAINMEMPMTVCSILALCYLIEKNLPKAAVFAVLALLVKGVSIFISATVFFAGFLLFFLDESRRFRLKTLIWLLVPMVFGMAQFYASVFFLNQKDGPDMVGFFHGWYHIKKDTEMYLFVICVLIWLGFLIIEKVRKKVAWRGLFEEHYAPLIFFTATAGWFAVFINSLAGFPRYKLLLMPLIVLCVFYSAGLFIKRQNLLNTIHVFLIVLFSLGSYGLFHSPQEDKDHVQDHVILERSLEYRSDLRLRARLAKEIEERFFGYTIGAPFLMGHILALPQLGYVHQKLDVVMYGFPCTYGGIRPFKGLAGLNIPKTIWIGVKQPPLPPDIPLRDSYPVSQNDKVIEEMWEGNRKATLFMGGTAIEKMRLISRALLRHLANQGLLKNPYQHNFGITSPTPGGG